MVDMSDVLVYDEGTASITLTAEHVQRIGMDAVPKLIWCNYYGGMKTMVMLTPQIVPEGNGMAYGGIAVIEGKVHPIWILMMSEGGTAFMLAPA